MPRAQSDPAAALLHETVVDALEYLSARDLSRVTAVPIACLVAFTRELSVSRAQMPADTPASVWAGIRKRYPRAAAFPLGPSAERATKRYVTALLRFAANPDGTGRRSLATRRPTSVAHGYLAYLLFEISLLNLRSSSEDVRADYGYRYHWPGERWRPLVEEAGQRQALQREAFTLAAQVLWAWAAIRMPGAHCPDRHDIQRIVNKVFAVLLSSSTPRTQYGRRSVTALGTRPSSAGERRIIEPIAYDARPIVFRGRPSSTEPGTVRNAEVDTQAIRSACGKTPHPLLQDFIEIAATVYLADVYVERAPLFERELVLAIPVSHPELWRRHERALALPVALLTGNDAVFRFTSNGGRAPAASRFPTATTERCVALLSGGLDSFAGAIRLLEERREPVFLSHTPSATLTGIQQDVALALSSRYGPLRHASIYAGAARRSVPKFHRLGSPPEQVLYQHGRSFLFLSLATAIALSRGIRDIVVSENGPIALNPTFSEARVNTRTTHPAFFAMFEELVRRVFDAEVRILNPFASMTKGEVTATLAGPWSAHAASTNSCWSYSKVALWAKSLGAVRFEGRHCGRCVPCLWRRTSMAHAGLNASDDAYLSDAVDPAAFKKWMSRRHLTVLADQVRFSANAITMTDEALVDLCPDFLEIGPGTLAERLSMYRRFSTEILDWVERGETPLARRFADCKTRS